MLEIILIVANQVDIALRIKIRAFYKIATCYFREDSYKLP